jgi:hypothetical protein
MERSGAAKRQCARACDFDFLAERIPQRDVRELVARLLHPFDVEMIRCAYDTRRRLAYSLSAFVYYCLERRYAALLEWALEQNNGRAPEFVMWGADPYSAAAESGSLDMLRWVKGHYPTCAYVHLHFNRASEREYLAVYDWLLKEMMTLSRASDSYVAERGFVQLMRRISTHRHAPIHPSTCMAHAAGADQVHFMEFMYTELNARLDAFAMSRAIRNNCVNAIQWLEAHGCPRPESKK